MVAGFINISHPHTQGLLGGGLLVFTEEGVSHVTQRERERERERVTRRRAERVNTVVE